MGDSQGVLTQQLEALSHGVEAARDPFTYKAGAISLGSTLALIVLAALSISSRIGGIANDPLGVFEATLSAGLGWLVVILLISFLTSLWVSIAVGMRANIGYGQSSAGLLAAAAGRMPAALGAWLLLIAAGVGLFALTWLLSQVAGVAVISVIVVILAIPLVIGWAVFALVAVVSLAFVPAFAAADLEGGSGTLLTKTLGLMLAYPGPSVLMFVLAGGIATLSAALFGASVNAATALGLGPIADEMLRNGREVSAILIGIISLLLFVAVLLGPWGIFTASVANYARRMTNDSAVVETPTRLFGFGWMRVRSAATAAGAAAAAARERVAEAAERASEVAASASDVTSESQDSLQPEPTETPPISESATPEMQEHGDPGASSGAEEPSPEQPSAGPSCPHCGTENPVGYRFCKNCGKEPTPAT